MREWPFLICCCFSSVIARADQSSVDAYLFLLAKLEYNDAKRVAAQQKDSLLRFEMFQLADVLKYEGQINKDSFKTCHILEHETAPLSVICGLKKGYTSLYYDRATGSAYRHFYDSYQTAKNYGNPILIQSCLLALLRYYNSEVGQNSHYHLQYLQRLENLQKSSIDRFWIAIYRMIFFTQSFDRLESEYFKLLETLNEFEDSLPPGSPLLTYLFYEKALLLELEKKLPEARVYYNKAINQARDYPFLRYYRFNGALRLMLIETNQSEFALASNYLRYAKNQIDKSDSLRSNYSLDLYEALLMKAQHKYDSAFHFLWKADREAFQLGFTTNSLEINRLNVELETQEKENANLQLKQDRTWLITALAASVLVMTAGYFAYANQRAKTKMQLQEKEVQAMKLEKQMKEQEILGIDLMIEGQEKERQRIANDLHDDLGGQLAAVKIKLETLEQLHLQEDQNILLQETTSLLNEAYQKVRSMAHARNAGINAQDGLLPAVRNFASKVSVANRLAIQVEEHGMDTRLENSLEITLFRVIQELITNVIKHAQASEAIIHLTQHEDSINVMVEDNGIGFATANIKAGDTMGLYSIQKRIENLGGAVTIDSIAQKGTTIIIDIPLS